MNRILSKSAFFVTFIGLILGCTSNGLSPDNEVYPVQIPASIATGTTEFAFDFIKALQKDTAQTGNLFVSPLSLHMALGMLLNGAENETADEIRKVLKMDDVSADDLNNAYKTLIDKLPIADSRVKLGLANSIWVRNDIVIENLYKGLLKTSFDADVTSLAFDVAAKNKINQWASDKTNGKIKEVINQIDPSAVMFLLNALYFKGNWANKFIANDTKDTPFKLADGSEKNVKMMFLRSQFNVTGGENYSAIELPYANGQFKMTVLIPNSETTVERLLDGFTAADWNELQTRSWATSTLKVGLPRFKFEGEFQLNTTLKKMGIQRAFGAAQFGKMTSSQKMFVGFIKQNTYLGIDEEGTEAAAVTTVGMVGSAGHAEPEFICDRPFALVISEKTSNTILFMGRIMNPDSK